MDLHRPPGPHHPNTNLGFGMLHRALVDTSCSIHVRDAWCKIYKYTMREGQPSFPRVCCLAQHDDSKTGQAAAADRAPAPAERARPRRVAASA